MKNSTRFGSIFVLMATVLWGTTGSTQGLAPAGATPLAIGALRMLIGGFFLLLFALFKGAFNKQVTWNKKLVLLGSLSMAAYQPFFFAGVSMTGIAFGTVLGIGSAPIFTGIIELIRGKKLSLSWMFATSLAVLGCVLLFSGQAAISLNIYGALFSLLAGLSYAFYVQATKELFSNYSREAVNALIFFLSGLILLPILFFQNLDWVLSAHGIMVSLHLGLITVAIAYTLFGLGLASVSTQTAATLTLGEPFTAAMLGIFLFKETFSTMSLLGILLLFTGLIITAVPFKRKDKTQNLCLPTDEIMMNED